MLTWLLAQPEELGKMGGKWVFPVLHRCTRSHIDWQLLGDRAHVYLSFRFYIVHSTLHTVVLRHILENTGQKWRWTEKPDAKHLVLVSLGLQVSMIQVPVWRNHFRDSSCEHCPGRTPGCWHTVAVMASILSITMDGPVDKQVTRWQQSSTHETKLKLFPRQAELHPLCNNQEGSLFWKYHQE